MKRLHQLWVLGLALLMAPAVGGAEPRDTEFRVHPDGRVAAFGTVFPDLSAYVRSDEFRESGRRCGTRPRPDAPRVGPTDCNFFQTVIDPSYNPGETWTIQVVFHIIMQTGGQGAISDELIHSQIVVLNEDFQAIAGSNGAEGTNTKVNFQLATLDPNGQATTGINRITNDDYFLDPGPGAFNNMKFALRWDTTRYLNIYTNDAAGNLGYATFPQENAGDYDDGVVLLWEAVGKGAPLQYFDLGRTGTHEVGHYLGLFHTFQGGCGDFLAPYTTGDLVSDTVPEAQAFFGCPSTNGSVPNLNSCGSGLPQPIENYMDYSDDACMNRFTAEQMNRLRCSMMNYRSTLYTVGSPVPVASPAVFAVALLGVGGLLVTGGAAGWSRRSRRR